VVAAQAEQLPGHPLGELLADVVDHLRALLAAVEVIAQQDDRVLVIERGKLGHGLFEGLEVAVDIADRERPVRHLCPTITAHARSG
jgi:hypothetical protein